MQDLDDLDRDLSDLYTNTDSAGYWLLLGASEVAILTTQFTPKITNILSVLLSMYGIVRSPTNALRYER